MPRPVSHRTRAVHHRRTLAQDSRMWGRHSLECAQFRGLHANQPTAEDDEGQSPPAAYRLLGDKRVTRSPLAHVLLCCFS